jgi:plasmid stability protein
MPKTIQVRDVSDDVHGILKARAAREGMSLSDYLKRELQQTAARPSIQEWLDRTQQAKPISAKISSAKAVRELRESR